MSQRIALVISTRYQDGTARDQELHRTVSRLTASLLDPEIGNFDAVESLYDAPVDELRDQIGMLMAPLTTLLFGWQADPVFSIMVATLFLLLYITLYLARI